MEYTVSSLERECCGAGCSMISSICSAQGKLEFVALVNNPGHALSCAKGRESVRHGAKTLVVRKELPLAQFGSLQTIEALKDSYGLLHSTPFVTRFISHSRQQQQRMSRAPAVYPSNILINSQRCYRIAPNTTVIIDMATVRRTAPG